MGKQYNLHVYSLLVVQCCSTPLIDAFFFARASTQSLSVSYDPSRSLSHERSSKPHSSWCERVKIRVMTHHESLPFDPDPDPDAIPSRYPLGPGAGEWTVRARGRGPRRRWRGDDATRHIATRGARTRLGSRESRRRSFEEVGLETRAVDVDVVRSRRSVGGIDVDGRWIDFISFIHSFEAGWRRRRCARWARRRRGVR